MIKGKLFLFLVLKGVYFIEYNVCFEFFGDSIYQFKENSSLIDVTDFT